MTITPVNVHYTTLSNALSSADFEAISTFADGRFTCHRCKNLPNFCIGSNLHDVSNLGYLARQVVGQHTLQSVSALRGQRFSSTAACPACSCAPEAACTV